MKAVKVTMTEREELNSACTYLRTISRKLAAQQCDNQFMLRELGLITALTYAWQARSAISPWSPASVMPIIR